MQRDDDPRNWDSLTSVEENVVALVTRGLTNRAIGLHLSISPHTVDTHLRRIFRKLGVCNRVALAAAAGRRETR
jgi:DNA-binding CsgD family transcriptional regulator